jgi:hypothetical protein
VHFDSVADLDRFLVPALPDQFDRAQAANIPDHFAASFVRYVDVIANMRVFEPDFLDDAFNGRWVIRIEFRNVRVMREGGGRESQERECGERFQFHVPWCCLAIKLMRIWGDCHFGVGLIEVGLARQDALLQGGF